MSEQKELKPLINDLVKLFRKYHVDYNQSRYVFKEVRKELGLKAKKNASKGTVKRLSHAELDKFLEAAFKKGPLIGLMMVTLYETGTRVSEFINLQPDDLYSDELRIVIKNGKGNKRREVPITRHLSQALQVHLNGRKVGFLFESNRHHQFTTRRVQQIVKSIAKEAGLQKNITPHMLRHTRATLLAEKGMAKDLLQVFLGHEKPETTEIYTRTAALNVQKGFLEATRDQ